MKEYTVNVDIQIFAQDEEDLINQVSKIMTDNNVRYWLGNITEETEG